MEISFKILGRIPSKKNRYAVKKNKKTGKMFIGKQGVTRSWEKDGVTRYTTEVVADQMRMLGQCGDSAGSQSSAGDSYSQPMPEPPMNDTPDDEIPF